MRVLTFGCAVNQSDSEIMRGLLKKAALEGVDCAIVNTCTVKTPTENKIRKMLKGLAEEGANVVVAGCMPKAAPAIADDFPSFSFIGTNIQDIADAVRAVAAGERYVKISGPAGKLALSCERSSNVIGIVQVAEGCLGSCSYCQTKNARGELTSYAPEEIVATVRKHVREGVKEVWLTGQDMGAYGLDIGERLPTLLNDVSSLDGDFKVRVGMMNPTHVMEYADELLKAYESERIYKFAHIPVQSGDDQVLNDMGRGYTAGDYLEIAEKFSRIQATLSTDVIVGYPTEDEAAFKNTLELVKKVKPDIINITRYWARPGTRAAALKQHPGKETKRRSRILNRLFERIGLEKNTAWVGWEGGCLISSVNDDGTVTARNDHYKPVVLPGGKLGEHVRVRIEKATHFDLRGVVCD